MSTRRRPPKPLIVLVVLALLVAGAVWWWVSANADDRNLPSAAGIVEVDEYLVSPATAGRVEKVHVTEGSTVDADAPVVTLDGRGSALQLTQAEQQVTAAQAQVTNAKNNGSDADVTAAQAQVKQAQAAVDLVKLQQSYSTVTAPHAGVVTSVTVNAGQNAAPGATIARIIDPAGAYVRAYVPEPYLSAVPVGTAVNVTAAGRSEKDADNASENSNDENNGAENGEAPATTDNQNDTPTASPGHMTGTVEYVSSQAEFTPNNVQTPEQRAELVYEVRVRLDPVEGAGITPGLPVDVTW